MKRAIFLDRDGTIVEEIDHRSPTDDLALLPGAAQALHSLKEKGFLLVIVTNQGGVGRGEFTEEDVRRMHRGLAEDLSQIGLKMDGIYYCPHHPDATLKRYRVECPCRKPKAGLLERASDDLSINLVESFMVGDKLSDVEAGRRVGCRTILVLTGHGRAAAEQIRAGGWPDVVVPTLTGGARWVLSKGMGEQK